MADIRRSLERVAFYARGVARECAPYSISRRRLAQAFDSIVPSQMDPAIKHRVNYYNRMTRVNIPAGSVRIADAPWSRSRYYIDLMEYAKGFGPDARINFLFGDITHIPDEPCIVKSRPISGDSANSVLFNINKFRHFHWVSDKIRFLGKRDSVVWRGIMSNQARRSLVARFDTHPHFDIGYTGDIKAGYTPKRPVSIADQCQYRFILSVEGNDVATNLKWIMSSNSLCLSPRLRYETWFMEGTLVPGRHFVELREDFADLEDKVAHYRRHPDEAMEIIANANAYVRQFRDKPREDMISQLVLQKFFERTGQRAAEPFSADLFD